MFRENIIGDLLDINYYLHHKVYFFFVLLLTLLGLIFYNPFGDKTAEREREARMIGNIFTCFSHPEHDRCKEAIPFLEKKCMKEEHGVSCGVVAALHGVHISYDSAVEYAVEGCELEDKESCNYACQLFMNKKTELITPHKAAKYCDMYNKLSGALVE